MAMAMAMCSERDRVLDGATESMPSISFSFGTGSLMLARELLDDLPTRILMLICLVISFVKVGHDPVGL